MYPNTAKVTKVLLATYADAVVPQAAFIADVGPLSDNSSEFNLCLQPRCTIDLRPMNDEGDLGAMFVFP
jgi:hypothetical protein